MAEVAEPVVPVVDEKENALKRAISFADSRSLVVKGLHQVCKKVNAEIKPKFVILANNAGDADYKKIVTALCNANKVPLILENEAETLGEWLGFCKRDVNKNIRKKVKCCSLAVMEFAPETKDEERKIIEALLKK
jgi:ribosomal protein L7Ae-like RNA K-turn-binding protein